MRNLIKVLSIILITLIPALPLSLCRIVFYLRLYDAYFPLDNYNLGNNLYLEVWPEDFSFIWVGKKYFAFKCTEGTTIYSPNDAYSSFGVVSDVYYDNDYAVLKLHDKKLHNTYYTIIDKSFHPELYKKDIDSLTLVRIKDNFVLEYPDSVLFAKECKSQNIDISKMKHIDLSKIRKFFESK